MLSLSDTNPRFLQSWLRLQKLISSGILSPVRQENTVYVDSIYGSAAGQRNNPAKPFQTLQQAVDAAFVNDTILLAPGTFVGNTVLPAKDGIGIIGTSEEQSVLAGAIGVAQPVLSYQQGVNVTGWFWSDFLVQNNSGGPTPSIAVDCTGTAGAFTGFGLLARNLFVSGAVSLYLRTLNQARFENCLLTGSTDIAQCSSVEFELGSHSDVLFDYVAVNEPSGGQGNLLLSRTKSSNVVLLNLAQVVMSHGTAGDVTTTFVDEALPAPRAGSFQADYSEMANLTARAAGTIVTDLYGFKLNFCKLVNASATRTAGTATVRGTARNCEFHDASAIVADDAALDIRGSEYQDSWLSGPNNGTIDRSMIQFTATIPLVTAPIPYPTPPLPVGAQFRISAIPTAAANRL